MKSIIRNYLAKLMAGRSDDGIMITLKDPQRVTLAENILMDTLMRYGIDPTAIKSEAQLKSILQQIKNSQAAEIRNTGIRNAESAKVFEMTTGKEIPKGSEIMGGQAVKNESGSLMSVPDKKGLAGMEYELPPPGSRGGADDIAAPVQSSEETIKNMIEAENKKNIANMRQRKMLEEAIDDASPGFADDIKVDAELVAENLAERMGLVYDDLPTKQRLDIYDQAYTGLSKQRFKNKPEPEDKADGGRIGLKGGADAATESFSKSAGSSRPGRTGSVNISSSGGVTFDPGGRDNPVDDRSTFEQTVNQRKAPIKQKSGIEKMFDAGQEFNYLRNLAIGNFPGIAKQLLLNYGKQKLLDDQVMLDTEDDTMMLAKGGRAGFFMGSQFPKGLATLRQMLNFMGKKSDKVKNPSDVLKMVNPKSLNAVLEDPRLQGKVNIKEGILASDMVKGFQSKMGEDRVQLVKDMLSAAKNIKKADTSQIRLKNEMIEDLMKKGVDRRMAEQMATTMSRLAEDMAGKFKDSPKLTDEGILELENVLKNMETGGKDKRSLNADGGRIGLKDGMNRRTFLKLLGGLASIPIVGKVFKPLKTVKGVKNVPIIKTDNVPGKPEWFDALVNKVIIEGDDVTKKFATKEREIVHVKKLDEDTTVRVTQDMDQGAVRVEYESPDNVYGENVLLQYKKSLPDEGDPRPSPEFATAESGPVARVMGPDDVELDVDEVGGMSIKDLDSDVSKLKEYATGQKPTMKELVQNIKRKDKAARITDDIDGAASDAVVRRQGDYDPSDYDDGMASGGIARMLGE